MSDRDQRFSENTDTSSETSAAAPTASSQIVIDSETPSSSPAVRQKIMQRAKNKIGKLHLFAAFCENPANVSFQTQEENERVLLFLRKSQWINAPWIISTVIFALIPLLLYVSRELLAQFIPSQNFLLILIPLYYLVILTYAFVNFVTWYYNAALITDKRIIDIDFHQIVLKDVAETKLALVQDVSYKQDGVLPNIFGYGFVLIQTAGTLDNFEFYNLPQPARIVEVVEGLIGGKRYYEP